MEERKIVPGDWVVISYRGEQFEATVTAVYPGGVPSHVRIQNDVNRQGHEVSHPNFQIKQVTGYPLFD